jgi:hypothetical protein
MLEQQIAKIDCETYPLFGPHATNVPIYRELSTEADRIVPIDSENGRAKKKLVRLRVSQGGVFLHEPVGSLAYQFGK